MRPAAPRPPRPAGSPSSSGSFGSSGSFHREPCSYVIEWHLLLLPLLRLPPSSDDEPSNYGGDVDADEIGDPEEPYAVSDSSLSSRDVSSAGASYGSERESASLSSGHSGHFSSDRSSGSGFVGYCSVTSGSASDASSDDDLVNRHFVGIFPPP
ncbi:hypothetical protein PIB30_019878 [Stylosanthes scabra]|uniref:Uncharacterized protein n=1 Tax=Stylosanthes scabra TaxID=79078 RepID=A0ABU6T880_9FABA|nr:hypothetical protein [Stylosanthes scabra]